MTEYDTDNMYKILKGLENLRTNENSNFDTDFTAKNLEVNEYDFPDAVELAIDEGYIKGLTFTRMLGGGGVFAINDPRLSPSGREFLEELKQLKLQKQTNSKPCIFLSHSSKDKKYGDVLQKFITGLGVQDEQLIYTSHPLHKIPLDENIYEYLRKAIDSDVFVIFLWSDTYLESLVCLSEMGATWLAQKDYSNIYVPSFNFNNPKYHECPVDTKKRGIVLNADTNCKATFIDLKDKIVSLFNLNVTELKISHLIDQGMNELMEINKS